MVTSTSKLYDYLKGFETACFTGRPKSDVVHSIEELLADEFLLLRPESNESERNEFVSEIASACDQYLTKFYSRIRRASTSKVVKEVADKAKDDSKQLSHLMSIMLMGSKTPISCLGVTTLTSAGARPVIDICDKCPYYLKNTFCILYAKALDDEDDSPDLNGHIIKLLLPESKYLAKAMLRAAHLFMSYGIDINSLNDYFMIFNHILTCSKIFELMNPSKEVREAQIIDTLKLLTAPALDCNSDRYKKHLSTLYAVFDDIKEGKKRYIQAIKVALDRNRDFINSKYDEVADAYYSTKGTGQSRFTKLRWSILSSSKEVDFYKEDFKEFDEYVGFHSHYAEANGLDLEADQIYCIRTILINNPGKFKGRIIHIFDNPIQDRANYIQRRTSAILKSLANDSMKDQDKGRRALGLKTLEWASESDPTQRIGIYGYDFSNATDTLDQHFQWEILNFIFGPEVANFWDKVSKLPKFIQHEDGHYERYVQLSGQPQGGLSSFNSFSLAHHFIFLMDMKVLGFENVSAPDFYWLLGDDSHNNSVYPEIDFYDPNIIESLDGGVTNKAYSDIEKVHFMHCQEIAGLVINYDKSTSIHYDSDEAKIDFAKVTYCNGRFFSPIPFRLAMKYCLSLSDKFAVAIWRGERNDPKAKTFMDLVLTHANNPLIDCIVKCGEINFLAPFYDKQLSFNIAWLARLRYANVVSHLNMSLACLTLSDHERDWASSDSFSDALALLFQFRVRRGKKLVKVNIDYDYIASIDTDHKILQVIERNEQILESLKQAYSCTDTEDQLLSLLISPLASNYIDNQDFVEMLEYLADTSKAIRLAQANPEADISLIFPDYDSRFNLQMKRFADSFMTRGIAKKARDEAVLFDSIVKLLTELDRVLGPLDPIDGAKHSNALVSSV